MFFTAVWISCIETRLNRTDKNDQGKFSFQKEV